MLEWGIFIVLIVQVIKQLILRKGLLRILKQKHSRSSESTPDLSVLVALKNESKYVGRLIRALRDQSYPSFEVVLVDDASNDDSLREMERAIGDDPRFRIIQSDSRQLTDATGKKAALMIAQENARFHHWVLTDADCIPSDNQWLQKFANAFGAGADVVIGTGAFEASSAWFDTLYRAEAWRMAMQYHAAAALEFPYMSVGRSFGYTKAAFDKAGGFQHHAHILSGSDDLLLQSFPSTLSIQSAPEALTLSSIPRSFGAWIRQKSRHVQAGKQYPFFLLMILFLSDFLLITAPILVGLSAFLGRNVFLTSVILLTLNYVLSARNYHTFNLIVSLPRSFSPAWALEYPASWLNALISISGVWVKKAVWTIER